MSCTAKLMSGKNKGQLCPNKAKINGKCGRHAGKEEKQVVTNIGDVVLPFFGEVLCQGVFATGEKKGQPCDRKASIFISDLDVESIQIRSIGWISLTVLWMWLLSRRKDNEQLERVFKSKCLSRTKRRHSSSIE